MRGVIKRYSLDFFQLLFPKVCLGCEVQLLHHEQLLCLNCATNLPFTDFFSHTQNKTYQSIRAHHPIQFGFSLLYFKKKSIVQHIIHQLKYKNQPDIGVYLGDLMGRKFSQNKFNNTFTTIMGVPISNNKLKKRGYNQCNFIIKGLNKHLNLKDVSTGFIKKQSSKSQTTAHRFERFNNQEAIYKIQNNLFDKHEHLLIIDDIITTGATLNLLISEIRQQYPDIKISVASIAITTD